MFPRTNIPRWIIIVLDLCISAFSLFLAYALRFDLSADLSVWKSELSILAPSLPVFFLVRGIVFYSFGIHRNLVRYASTTDFRRLFIAITISSLIFLISGLIRFYFIDGYFLFPMSVLIMEYICCIFLATVSRFIIKLIYLESVKDKSVQKNVVIYGAGVSGLIAKRTIEKDTLLNLSVIGFIDDNKKLAGTRIEGKHIWHTSKLEELLKDEKIEEVIVAIQDPDEINLRKVLETALEHGISAKRVPSPGSWINGEFSTKAIQNVRIEDLLGRKPIVLNKETISRELSGKVILITGAAGSIGSGLVREIAGYEPRLLVLLDQAESPLYEIQQEMLRDFPGLSIEVVIGDICNLPRMRLLFETFHPEEVFHAAAYKHVPMMEDNPAEAVQTNIRGTHNLASLAVELGVRKFVMVSTDKAVNPTNVMGASKRIAEMVVQSFANRGKTQFITTRFGNVLGSNGSVIPLFRRQIENGGPVTVTDERITRFFMTIPEACQLVLEAGTIGNDGEILVFDMGESVRIIDLAKNMIRLSGLTLGKDIEIKITGLRPGEKLYEELLNESENTLPTHHPKILKARVRELSETQLSQLETLLNLSIASTNMELVAVMKSIVPEYISNNSEFSALDK